MATYQFEDFTLTWEHRQFAGNPTDKTESVGCYFYGTKGTFHMGWQRGWTFYPSGRGEQEVHEEPQLNLPDQQNIKGLWTDFLSAIETGSRPVCDIEAIHYSTNLRPVGDAVVQGRTQRHLGRERKSASATPTPTDCSAAITSPWVYPKA